MKQFYILLFVALPVTAQIPESLLKPIQQTVLFDDYEGIIYESLNYKKANLIDENSTSYDTNLRYDIYNDRIEYKFKDEFFQIDQNESIHAMIGSDLYYYCDLLSNRGLSVKGYFILVDQKDNYKIYKKLSLKLTEPKKAVAIYGSTTPGKIRKIVTYYVENNGKLLEIPTNKKEFFELFNDKKPELKNFISAKKLKLKKEEHLVILMSKYNELIHNNGERLKTVLASKGD